MEEDLREKERARDMIRTMQQQENAFPPAAADVKSRDSVQVRGKAGKYRDTGSAEPGSAAIFGSVSGSENHFLGIF